MSKTARKLRFSDLTNPFQRFRSQTGLSQIQLAAALGVGQAAISKYEASGKFPEPEIAKRFVSLARKHKVRMDLDEVFAALQA